MKELENLLNSLVQRGRKPWGVKTNFYWIKQGESLVLDPPYYSRTFRELVSLESGLWQFCVENKMVNWWIWIGRNKRIKTKEGGKSMQRYWKNNHEYRLLESALIPEKELAQFLVENIKVEGWQLY